MTAPTLQFQGEGSGVHVDLERLVASRMLVQGSSGAGKSWLARYLLEQTHGKIQQFVIDADGEFATLRERFDYVVASADGEGDVPADPRSADLLCRQLVELGASAILDIYELDPEDREEFVARFLRRLINMPKELWNPALVVVDEAHEFAPEGGAAPPSKKPMELIVSKGRKRGLCAIYMTQRLSKLSKNASDLQNLLVGYTGLDVDVRRAGDMLGFDKAQRDELKRLEPGEFFAFGPAISKEVTRVRSGPVQTHHPEPGEILPPTPPPRGALRQLVDQLEGISERAEEEDRTIEALESHVDRLERELADARRDRECECDDLPELVERLQEAEEYSERIASGRHAAADRLEEVTDDVHRRLESVIGGLDGLRDVAGLLRNGDGPPARKPPEQMASSGKATRRDAIHAMAKSARRDPATLERELAAAAAELTGPERRVLNALATLAELGVDSPPNGQLAPFARYSPKSTSYEKARGSLKSSGLVDYPMPGCVRLTPEGAAIAEAEVAPTLEEIHQVFFSVATGPETRVLEALIDAYPRALSNAELAPLAGYSPKSTSYEKARGALRTKGAVEYPEPGMVRATELLFPKGL